MAQLKDPLLVTSAFVGIESRSPSKLDRSLVADSGHSDTPPDGRTWDCFWSRNRTDLPGTAQPALGMNESMYFPQTEQLHHVQRCGVSATAQGDPS